MIFARLLAFFSLQILCVFGLGNNLVADWPHINENLDWQHKELNSLVELLKTLTEVGNVTLIGWQNVWNTNGSLKEVRMIELTILKESVVSQIWNPVEMDIYEEIPEILHMMNVSGSEMITSTSLQQWSANGDLEESLYVDRQDVYVLNDDGIIMWYQNMTVSNMAQIQQLMKQMDYDTNVGLSVLKWNADGTFNLADSVIVPELLSYVIDAANATHHMLETSLMGMSQAVLLHPEDVAKNMVLYMKQKFPDYKWHAVDGSSGSHVDSDVYMSLNYNAVNVLEFHATLDIYGAKV